MSAPKNTSGVVAKCAPRRDGSFLVTTRNKLSGVSPVEIPVGRLVSIHDGLVGVSK